MAGIVRYGSYVPYWRLTRAAMGGGRGERAVASFDEDAVSMAVEAGRDAVRGGAAVDALVLATLSPAYAEKLDAATVQAALDLPEQIASLVLGGSSRMGLAGLLLGLDLATAGRRTLVCASDVVVGAPGGARESQGGDGAAAFLTGPDAESVAVLRGRASTTIEILDAWRLPDERFARSWEERFAADTMAPAVLDTVRRALAEAGVEPAALATVILDGVNPRVLAALPRALALAPAQIADSLAASVGRTGTAHAGLLLARALDHATPGDRILVVSEADGVDALVLEVTARLKDLPPHRPVDRWISSKRNDLAYTAYLKWRGILPFEPPRRPDPERPAGPPMRRHERWKLAFVGSRCTVCRTGHLPPQRVCVKCGAVDQMVDERFADTSCRVATYTLDHLAYSLQPPVVAAFVDYEGGGRFSCELTDVDPSAVAIGDRLEMTFRRLFTAQGVHNYFWKARPGR
ncbi:MAG TPA: OB-fold domain-containing protein [Candidatus Limnocylindria bacterium]|nr:OB-fold domain-containing protein [Candidatus Limnocylindria bacterium]